MNNAPSSNPDSIRPVRVQRHKVDWEASDLDLADLTAQRAMSLAPQIATGCWFLNPRYTVSSPTPTAEFFRTMLKLRSTWLRTCRQILGNSGQRHSARQVVTKGRLGAILSIDPIAVPSLPSDPSLPSVPIADLPDDQRREAIEAGQIAKMLAYSGTLFIDGNPVPPRTWQARADELLKRSLGPGIVQDLRQDAGSLETSRRGREPIRDPRPNKKPNRTRVTEG